ncbi:DinB family protein [Streptomyces sp. B1866]|uniref:mycothiol transferase n=1 Tax=Streptomyces sp. B1866 TaxID=3075431 RepID=UPI002891DEBB|nr:DinB family protein [Streptomyces sp. B1866]MDT3398416.1 DinB family protein [Streptomyces sp. B1866]
MATTADLLVDAFGRVREAVQEAVADLGPDELAARPGDGANSIAWLVWHLTRVQDDHLADVAGTGQVWTAQGWYERFGLPFPPEATGYGHTGDQVAAVREVTADLLTGYHDAVCDTTVRYVAALADADLDRIVDEAWTPPVTLGVRLVSVIDDDLQHAGQAAYVRGLLRAG